MKSDGDLITAYDLTGSYRAAAELCCCSHHTVKKAVTDRAACLPLAVHRTGCATKTQAGSDVISYVKGSVRVRNRHFSQTSRGIALGSNSSMPSNTWANSICSDFSNCSGPSGAPESQTIRYSTICTPRVPRRPTGP